MFCPTCNDVTLHHSLSKVWFLLLHLPICLGSACFTGRMKPSRSVIVFVLNCTPNESLVSAQGERRPPCKVRRPLLSAEVQLRGLPVECPRPDTGGGGTASLVVSSMNLSLALLGLTHLCALNSTYLGTQADAYALVLPWVLFVGFIQYEQHSDLDDGKYKDFSPYQQNSFNSQVAFEMPSYEPHVFV